MCELCRIQGCIPVCPNYIPKRTLHYCSICKQGIENGEDYIVNDSNLYAHWDCFKGTRELLDWLGYRVKVMEDYRR